VIARRGGPGNDPAELRDWLRRWVAEVVGLPLTEVDADRPLEEYGLSSRDAVALAGELEDLLGAELRSTLVWDHPTISQLARYLTVTEQSDAAPVRAIGIRTDRGRAAGSDEAIAVVGLGCRLPGAEGPEGFWELLAAGTDAVTTQPTGRGTTTGAPMRGGFLSDVAGFDAEFFGIAPREATAMDPQQRLLLEVAWEALEHAGVAPASLRGSATGVFVGVSSYDYALRTSSDAAGVGAWTPTGVATSITANRLSYLLDLRGPSLAIDTACSSSLVAVHQACRSLRWGECDAALAAGVNLLLHPAMTTAFSEAGALAPDGRCKAFAADADGIARGEGAGVVVLKRLSDVRRDGDAVLAVIRGSAVNSDGRSNGLTAPNPAAQADLLRAAYADAGLDPAEVDYVEAHGTGTLLGDPIEAGALGTVLGAGRPAERPLLIGSVKTNLGHLEAAAGIVGLIKVTLAMRHGKLPASLHFHRPNPYIPFHEARLRVVDEPTQWPRRTGLATAGVSGFGFGGTNAHVVLEEAPVDVSLTEPAGPAAPAVLLISATNPGRLADAVTDLAGWLDTPEGLDNSLSAVGRSLARRGHHRSRAAIVARRPAEALEALRALAQGRAAPGLVTGTAAPDAPNPVWVFSGYGSQWPGMARVLLADEPAFAAAVAELEPLIAAEAGFSLGSLLRSGERAAGVERAQVAIFGVQVALAALWRHHGVTPAAVIGHSMGEVAAAVAAGALPLADAVRVIAVRSRLLATVESAGTGAMAAVGLSAAELAELGRLYPDVSVAVHAAPCQLTVAGAADRVRELVAHADRLGRTARLLDVRGAGHTAAVDPILGELAAELAGIAAVPPQVPLYSTVVEEPRVAPSGRILHGAGYWVAGARRPVRFAQAVAAAVADGHSTFVEVSPHPIALPAVAATAAAGGRPDPVLAVSLRRDTDDAATFRAALALLHVHGVPLRPEELHGQGPRPELPRTRWRHTRYWADEAPRPAADPGPPGVHVELPDGRHAWQLRGADDTVTTVAVVTAAAEQVLGACRITELVPRGTRPAGPVELGTTLDVSGGLQLHARAAGGGWVLIADARAAAQPVTTAAPQPAAAPAPVTLGERLRAIVAGVMGFAPDQLDPHVPLVELGLDSLMAVRIKNIVEHELGTPPLVVGMLRGAGLASVEEHVAGLLGHRAAVAAASPVGPRDATERLLLRTCADELGAVPVGVTEEITDTSGVHRLATRLSERLGREIDPGELLDRRNIAGMADLLRAEVEGDDGSVLRVLRPAVEGGRPPLFLFHPAGGPCSVYHPLVERLGEDQPCYGLERVEGELADRVEQYLPLLAEVAGDGPYRLAGWSFGGALAFEVARQLVAAGAEVDLLAMIDTVRPVPDGVPEATAALQRWQRFAGYVERTYGRPLPLPLDELAEADEEHQLDIVTDLMQRAGLGMSQGVLRHQRTSWIDSRVAERHTPAPYPGQVVLYRAEAMHDGALELDPRYGRAGPDAGWGPLCPRMEIVPVRGDHLAVIDPPVVNEIAEHLASHLAAPVSGLFAGSRFRS